METVVLDLNNIDMLHQISMFISRSNITSTGNISYLSVDRLVSFRDLGAIAIGLTSNDKLCGTIFTVPVATPKKKFGCTTFLCLDPEVRNQGNVRLLRNKLIEVAEQHELWFGYHTTDLRLSPNAIQLQSWYIVKDPSVAAKIGYRSTSNLVLDPSRDVIVRQVTTKKEFLFEPSRYCFVPDEVWMKYFPTYQITSKEGNFVGIFSLNQVPVKISETDQEATLDQLCWSFGSSIVEGALQVTTAPVLIGYVVGSITIDNIRSNSGKIVSHQPWTSMYGTEIRIKPSELYLPLI